MRSFACFDTLGSELATLDVMFMLLSWYSIVPGCGCGRALNDTDADALILTGVDRCV